MPNAQLLLAWIFLVSFPWEAAVTIALFVKPELAGAQFGLPLDPATLFLSRLLGAFMALLTALCALCGVALLRNPSSKEIIAAAAVLGSFWLGVGLLLFFHPGSPAYVLIDSIRGAGILLLVLLSLRPHPARGATPSPLSQQF